MIGPVGIFSDEIYMPKQKREDLFSKMICNLNKNDYACNSIYGRNFSLGLVLRGNGNNKDLGLKKIDEDFAIAFVGYGKLSGENKLSWANEMIEKITPGFRERGEEILTEIEGSFECIIFFKETFFIASDRLGSKNLFCYETDRIFICAPDINNIINTGLPPKTKNIDAALQILISGFFLDNSTLATNISVFPAASLLSRNTSSSSKHKLLKYWHMPKEEGLDDSITSDRIAEFHERLKHAVYQLADLEKQAVIPLSGGLDSRAIACFLSERQDLHTVTYDMGDEVNVAQKVCKALNGHPTYFTNNMLCTDEFRQALRKMVERMPVHAVTNQYFYAPLFKQFFTNNSQFKALYDGVYLDILFSAPYTYKEFNFERFSKTYGGGRIAQISQLVKNGSADHLRTILHGIYSEISADLPDSDGVGRSQLFYATGRLRRYVNMSLTSRENYAYIFKPGFDYELMDFAFKLSLKVRKGILYTTMLRSHFPDVMKIQYKDSYGNRPKTMPEKMLGAYRKSRLRLSSLTKGMLGYSPFQADYFFLRTNGIEDYRNFFFEENHIQEIIEHGKIKELFNATKKKPYLFNLFQRILFLQQFYSRYNR